MIKTKQKKHKLISTAFCFSILFQHVGPLAVARQHDPAGSWTQWFFLASPGTPRCLNAFCGMHPSIFPSFSTCFCCIVSLCVADWRKGCFVSQCQWALFEGLVPAIFNGHPLWGVTKNIPKCNTLVSHWGFESSKDGLEICASNVFCAAHVIFDAWWK